MIVVQSPLRVSFIGGGTDFEDFYSRFGGAVLSSTIDKYIYVIIKERFDDKICLSYSKRETVDTVDELKHDLVREALKKAGVTSGVEVATMADVPSEGTGLGSSSTLLVGLLQALYAYKGESKPAQDLARDACEIEIDILGRPIGKQDQYIAAFGDLRFISFNGSETIDPERITLHAEDLREFGKHIILLYTGRTREAASILTAQKANIDDRVEDLCELAQLARHARDCYLNQEFVEFGLTMHRGWELKKQLADRITHPEIDRAYQLARQAGCLGGKICGAGGGGFLLLFCPEERQSAVRQALGHMHELPVQLERDGSKVVFDWRWQREESAQQCAVEKTANTPPEDFRGQWSA